MEQGQVVAVTGHRPQHLSLEDGWIQSEFDRLVVKLQPSVAISGMALGADTWWADAAVSAGIPLHAYVPFPEQDARWREDDRIFYRSLMKQAEKVVTVCDRYSLAAFQKRNEAMVDACGLLVAAWNGKRSGGTWNCLTYARRVCRPYLYVDVARRVTTLRLPQPVGTS